MCTVHYTGGYILSSEPLITNENLEEKARRQRGARMPQHAQQNNHTASNCRQNVQAISKFPSTISFFGYNRPGPTSFATCPPCTCRHSNLCKVVARRFTERAAPPGIPLSACRITTGRNSASKASPKQGLTSLMLCLKLFLLAWWSKR